MKPLAMAALVSLVLVHQRVQAQEPAAQPGDAEDVQELARQLEALKANYANEVRRLRELDMQLQAVQARLAGRVPSPAPVPPAPQPQAVAAPRPQPSPPPRVAPAQPVAPPPPGGTQQPPGEGYAGSASDAEEALSQSRRSVDDVKQQQSALFNRRLTVEAGLGYTRYDRKQLTLHGFLALDAIFLGNIGIENVESDTATINTAVRWGLSPRLTLNADVPWIHRRTTYQKGGAGGAASAIAEQQSSGGGMGDLTVSANYKLISERPRWPETVVTAGITAPTGNAPYGVDWKVIERDDDDFIRFAIPSEQPTGNGVWQANVGVSMVKTADPAILFASFGYIYSQSAHFDDLDSNPDTVNPGDVKLGNIFYANMGLAFAFNERTSLSLSYSGRFNGQAKTRYDGGEWTKVIGSDGNANTLNLGVTYALNRNTTIVTQLGVGLTPDAPDFSLSVKVPVSL